MQIAIRGRLTVFVEVLTCYCKVLFTEGIGVVQCLGYGPHSGVLSSWFTDNDTISQLPSLIQSVLLV